MIHNAPDLNGVAGPRRKVAIIDRGIERSNTKVS